MAHLRAWGDGSNPTASSFPPKLRYRPRTGELQVIPSGARDGAAVALPAGTQLVPDWRRLEEGELCFRPFDDTRMVPRGQPVPPRSGDPDYDGAVRVDVLVQGYGLCTLISTSSNMIGALDALHDTYVTAAEAVAGRLPLYRIDEPRSYVSKYSGDLLYVPQWTQIGWVDRKADRFGKALIPAPRPQISTPATATSAALPAPNGNDDLFATAVRSGEVVSPITPGRRETEPSARTDTAGRKVFAGDLDDEIPF